MKIEEIKVGDKITCKLWETMEYVTVTTINEDSFIGSTKDMSFKFTNLRELEFYEQKR